MTLTLKVRARASGHPLYRLVDEDSSAVVLTAEDIGGFFGGGPGRETRGTITLRKVRQLDPKRRKVENAELQVVDWRGDRIGAYVAGRVTLTPALSTAAGREGESPDYSYDGYTCEFEHAGEIWRRWAEGSTVEPGE